MPATLRSDGATDSRAECICLSCAAGVSDGLAAALPNPGVSAWLALTFRAKLAPDENVFILGLRQGCLVVECGCLGPDTPP